MELSLSTRVAEAPGDKERALLDLEGVAALARTCGYSAVCMRASQVGVHSPPEVVRAARAILDRYGLRVSMVTGDFPIPANHERAPEVLRHIRPYLDLAEALGSDLIRVGMKQADDIVWAQRACDEARERGIRLAHQCHTASLFETVAGSVATLRAVDRPNFGVIYEPANLEACGEDYGPAAIRALAPWIMNVYLQNQILHPGGRSVMHTWLRGPVRFDWIPLDDPRGIDFDAIFAGLRAIAYDGTITVHQPLTEGETPAEVARRSAAFLRRFVLEEGG